MDSTTAQIFCARLNVNIVETRWRYLISRSLVRSVLSLSFPDIYYFCLCIIKSECAFSKSRTQNQGRESRRRSCVYITRAILISYLRIQYHFSAASRQTGANRRKNVFVVDVLIWESSGVFIAVISILKAITREYPFKYFHLSSNNAKRNGDSLYIYAFETPILYVCLYVFDIRILIMRSCALYFIIYRLNYSTYYKGCRGERLFICVCIPQF